MTYIGTVPISLAHYKAVILAQQARPALDRLAVHDAFRDVVIDDRMIAELGPAMLGNGAIFIYGPPGTGKSTIAERLARMVGEPILIPKAIEVDNQIITVFDPTVHIPIDPQPEIDPRWILCERPAILVGGELERSQLDLRFDGPSGLHLAPVQIKANNGVLVIDDFGRQQMSPAEILNRWIVPMDRGIDYLTLNYGTRFSVPFDVRIVLSTNLDPSKLGDSAFFRRVPNKVYIGAISDSQFDRILHLVAARRDLEYRASDAEYLRYLVKNFGDGELRAYIPGVVCDMARAICLFERLPLRLNREVLDRVAATYFTRALTNQSPPPAADPPARPPEQTRVNHDASVSAKDVLSQWLAAQDQ